MKTIVTFVISLALLVIPVVFGELLKEEPLFYSNILITLSLCYLTIFYFIVTKFLVKKRLLIVLNLLPIAGFNIGLILHRVYQSNCDFETAIFDQPEVCNYIFLAEKFIYPAIYLALVVLVIDLVLLIKSLDAKN